MKESFGLEIINCENGFIVLEGNSLGTTSAYHTERRKWVCSTYEDLGMLVEGLAKEHDKRVIEYNDKNAARTKK